MSYYSIADINIEIANQELNLERLRNFQKEKLDKIDIQYVISYIDDVFSYNELSLSYEGKLFKEYEDDNNVYRVFWVSPGANQSQLIVVRPKEKSVRWKILLGRKLKEEYPKYFDFANHLAIENVLCNFQGFILHSAIVAYKKQGILFSAPSGTGKSTQAELWKKYKHADVLNGDRAFIRKREKEFWAYGSPLAGSSGIYRNDKVKINGIIILKQAKKNTIRKLGAKEAFLHLYRETLINMWDKNFVTAVVEMISELITRVPIYELACRPDEEAVELVYKTVISTENRLE